jgi:hypothetical protein
MGEGSGSDLKAPSPAWTPVALLLAVASLLAGSLGSAPLGPTTALVGGSAAALLSLAALQRNRRSTAPARLAMVALVVGVAALVLGAARTL